MRLAFVDLETTGGSPLEDRITEVGIIEVDVDPADPARPPTPIREWSALVNPGAPIPPFIETLTGITNAMVATAPPFEALAADILARLDGRLFVAHNARFDHGFLKNAFRRLGHPFRPPVLCTVRLSRKLYPGYARHNLDTLIERHRLVVDLRHRALGDARLLWQLWQRFHEAMPADRIGEAIDQLTARPSLPRHLDPDVLDTLPKTAGVYLFLGEPVDDERPAIADRVPTPSTGPFDGLRPLYIGKAKNLRQRVMAHFTGDHLSVREMEISQQVTRLEWIETGGGTQHDLGALLTEATLVKRLMPAYNRQLRKSDDVCAWRLVVDRGRGRWTLGLARPDDLFFAQDGDLYGPFATPRQAGVALRAIADAHGLCPALLRLDRVAAGKPCFSHQVKRCRGACVGLETVAEHTERLKDALASLAMRPWPFDGAIAFREGASYHVLDAWAYLGMAGSLDEARALATTQRPFDQDVYRLMVRRVDTIAAIAPDGRPVIAKPWPAAPQASATDPGPTHFASSKEAPAAERSTTAAEPIADVPSRRALSSGPVEEPARCDGTAEADSTAEETNAATAATAATAEHPSTVGTTMIERTTVVSTRVETATVETTSTTSIETIVETRAPEGTAVNTTRADRTSMADATTTKTTPPIDAPTNATTSLVVVTTAAMATERSSAAGGDARDDDAMGDDDGDDRRCIVPDPT